MSDDAESNKTVVSLSDLISALERILGREPTPSEKMWGLHVAARAQRAGQDFDETMQQVEEVFRD